LLEGLQNANKGNETINSNTVSRGMKAECQSPTSIFRDGDNILLENDRLIKEGWKQYFYETPNRKDKVKTREEDKRYTV